MKIFVLGAGLVGGPMARDLAKGNEFSVTAVDRDAAALERLRGSGVTTIRSDLKNVAELGRIVRDSDLVLSAVPGFMGFSTLKALIAAGKDTVDIAFFPEDPFLLEEEAKKSQVMAVVDCGVAPGMSNLLAGHAARQLDEVESLLILVGGLPVIRQWPYEYKAVFSPIDVIEEYTRPARYVENGREVVRPALSDPEYIDFPVVGTLEAFITDGLRTLIRTIAAPDMKEKTMRYPGHIEKIAMLRETGFFGTDEIEVSGARVRPIDVTARLLFPRWKLGEGEADITVMRIEVKGKKQGRRVIHRYELLDRYDEATRTHSMARTTGYAATSMVRLLARGLFRRPGIVPPEWIGMEPGCADFMLKELASRGVVYTHTVSGE